MVVEGRPDVVDISVVCLANATIIGILVRPSVGAIVKHLERGDPVIPGITHVVKAISSAITFAILSTNIGESATVISICPPSHEMGKQILGVTRC